MSDYRWLTPLTQEFLERDYLVPGQTVDQRVDVICNTAEKILNMPGFAARLKENFKKGWYSFSTPIWTNFGNDRGLPISCFGSYVGDSMESIAANTAEVMMMTKYGGGTSGYFGDLRHRGAAIRDNGESSGAVHFMQLFDNLINVVSQGKTRRGNFAPYLSIDHPDIMEFLKIRSEGFYIQDLSPGVCVPDYWMQEMIDGDRKKREVWAKVLDSRKNFGFPYIFFVDNANNNTVDVYKDKRMRIHHTNLCVTGDQLVVTSKGMKRVIDLYKSGECLELFSGDSKVNASPMRLIEKNAAVYEIRTTSGRSHKVTDYHKVKTDKGMVATKDLAVGDKICIQRNEGLFGEHHDPDLAFLLGLYQADSTQYSDVVFIDVWENDFDILQEVESCIESVYTKNNWLEYEVCVPNRGKHLRSGILPTFNDQIPSENGVLKKRLQSNKLQFLDFQKDHIPEWLWESNKETQAQYLRGLFIADGSANLGKSKGEPIYLSLGSTRKPLLQEIQILLSNMGINSTIYLLKEAGWQLLPDGKGGRKEYWCEDVWRLNITSKTNALKFNELTCFLDRKNVFIENRTYRDNTKKYDTVESVEYIGNEDVYCTTVDSEEHVWVCNSFITSNCSEIMLPNNDEESFVCDLSSMNVLYYDEWKDTDAVELLVYLLDAVMTEFIDKASKIKFLERPVKFAQRHRALGIGIFGWHSYLQSNMIPWESMESKHKNVQIAKNIHDAAYKASGKLADFFGEPEVLKGYGRRNTTLMAIAPTKSSAFIIGQASEGIEPETTNYQIKDLQKGKHSLKNKYLEKLLEEKGLNNDEVWMSIMKSGGSVQHLSCLNDHEKAVFKTFSEISPKEIIIQAAARQKYVDQGQSLNLMIHPSIPVKDTNALIIEAWQLGIKSLYYQKSVNAAQAFSRNILNCTSCEG